MNISNIHISGMHDNSCCIEPTFTLNGIPISVSDVRPPFAVEGRKQRAVAHLALLGVKRQEPASPDILFIYVLAKQQVCCFIFLEVCS